MPSLLARALAATVLLALLAGCAGKVADPNSAAIAGTGSIAPTPPTRLVPDSPKALMDAFAHAWNNRDPGQYPELFTDDYQFAFASFDSAGSAFANRSLTREDEIAIAQHLFVTGTASEPPAQRIVLTFDRTFIPEPDSRPGKAYPWHVEVKRNVVLSVDTGDRAFRITGGARFFLVRGDSAAIPPDLAARGFHADPNRWWIERWEDETLDTGGGLPADAPTPTATTTWGSLKALYR